MYMPMHMQIKILTTRFYYLIVCFFQDKCLFLCYYYTDGCHRLSKSSILILEAIDSTQKLKGFLLSWVFQTFKGYICIQDTILKKTSNAKSISFRNNCSGMNEETRCITKERKMVKNEWKNDDSDFLGVLYSIYKKLGQSFFHTYLLTC